MSQYDHDSSLDDSIDSSLDDSVERGGSIDFSMDDGFVNAAQNHEGRRIDAGTLVFAGVVVASIVGLWSMRFLGRSAAETAPVATRLETMEWINQAEAEGAPVPTGDLAILATLDKDSLNDLQYTMNELRNRQPFRYHGEPVPIDRRDVESGPIVHTRPEEQIKDEFEDAISGIGRKMRINAIIAPNSDRAQTILNGFRLTVEDEFEVPYEGREYTFKVERITRNGVVFLATMRDPVHEFRIDVPLHRDY